MISLPWSHAGNQASCGDWWYHSTNEQQDEEETPTSLDLFNDDILSTSEMSCPDIMKFASQTSNFEVASAKQPQL